MDINERIGECPRCHGPMSPAHVCDWSHPTRRVEFIARQAGKTDKLICELQAQLDAVTRENKMLRLKVNYCERKHAFCSDCHDKLPENHCWRCEKQRLESKLEAVTAERDALKAICRNAYAFLTGVDDVNKITGSTLITNNRWIQALNVTETRVEVPRE